ncbi:exopolysaccharide biosynthesis protein [Erythrobacter sp. 3-20A1M]|uniref:beta-1,4-glucuronosyltransferase WelK n=1 Tax=Erythrobacter sp. 3-20A1M TaxID=2653850 RepID=UPI001BFC8139|nr:glycosyltransferase [Erythrobacter sp. 3-20A1M]QWC56596.1 exopolysaccharide biosynthesis protein [Erythrobacter sp. 3-20A1M]
MRSQISRASGEEPVGSSLRLCLAASGGGHVRQLLDLEPLWRDYRSFFVTEDTALGESIAADRECYFVPHVALGQAKLGNPLAMLMGALRSIGTSFSIIRRTRPDVVITTGAGSMIFVMMWAKLLGARTILVDSFARFEEPSAFARLAAPLADLRIAQSKRSAEKWKGALAFDPFKMIDTPRPAKEPLMFATVGATLPFPRLVDLVRGARAKGQIPERIVLQVGKGADCESDDENLRCVETLPFDEVRSLLDKADLVVCHGGTGSLITALRAGCRVIAVPRRFEQGEHYDNHQAEITETFRQRGLLETADTPEEFAQALERVRGREPLRATTDPSDLIAYLREWIEEKA